MVEGFFVWGARIVHPRTGPGALGPDIPRASPI